MMTSSDLAVAPSNDIRNATGRDKNLDLAIVFFTNRVLAAGPRQPVIARTIQLAKDRLDQFAADTARARRSLSDKVAAPGMGGGNPGGGGDNQGQSVRNPPKARAFHMTGPYILNLALQEAGDGTPVSVIPTNWVYPESLMDAESLVMFGHHKDRSVHADGISTAKTTWGGKPWLMQRSLPNFFTKAQDFEGRVSPEDYVIHPTVNASESTGAVAIFLHHNKAGGTAVKVAMEQLFTITRNLTQAKSFSMSACAYSKTAVARTLAEQPTNPEFCEHPVWRERKLPACGRCRSPALTSLYSDDLLPKMNASLASSLVEDTVEDIAPNGWSGEKGALKCQQIKEDGKCRQKNLVGLCCKSCGAETCPATAASELQETTPRGISGVDARQQCATFKAQGQCTHKEMRGYCCLTCGLESCSAPNMMVGDYTMGLCNLLPGNRPCAYYTMLREPRKRIASSYLHCQYEPDDQLCMSHVLQAKEATFKQWVQHQGNYLFKQLTFDLQQSLSIEEQYAAYLNYTKHRKLVEKMGATGAWTGRVAKPVITKEEEEDLIVQMLHFKPNMLWLLEQRRGFTVTERDAQSVIQLLEYHFAVIGLVERFDESLEMYETVFGLPYPDAIRHKTEEQAGHQMHVHEGEDLVKRKETQKRLVDMFDTDPELDQMISIDLALYDKAVDLFEEQHEVMQAMKREAMGEEGVLHGFDEGPESRSWLQSIADETYMLLKTTGSIIMPSDHSLVGLPSIELGPDSRENLPAADDVQEQGGEADREEEAAAEAPIVPEARAHEAVSIAQPSSEKENSADPEAVAPQPAAPPPEHEAAPVDQHRAGTDSEEDMDDEERLAASLEAASLEEGRNAMGRRQRAKL